MASLTGYVDTGRVYLSVTDFTFRILNVYGMSENNVTAVAPGWTMIFYAGELPLHSFEYTPNGQTSKTFNAVTNEWIFTVAPFDAVPGTLSTIDEAYINPSPILSSFSVTLNSEAIDSNWIICPGRVYVNSESTFVAEITVKDGINYHMMPVTSSVDGTTATIGGNILYFTGGSGRNVELTLNMQNTDLETIASRTVQVISEDLVVTGSMSAHRVRDVSVNYPLFTLTDLPWPSDVTHIVLFSTDNQELRVNNETFMNQPSTRIRVGSSEVVSTSVVRFEPYLTRSIVTIMASVDYGLTFLSQYTVAFDSKNYFAHCPEDNTLRYCWDKMDPDDRLAYVTIETEMLPSVRASLQPAPGWIISGESEFQITFERADDPIGIYITDQNERCLPVCIVDELSDVAIRVSHYPDIGLFNDMSYLYLPEDTEWAQTLAVPRRVYITDNMRTIVRTVGNPPEMEFGQLAFYTAELAGDNYDFTTSDVEVEVRRVGGFTGPIILVASSTLAVGTYLARINTPDRFDPEVYIATDVLIVCRAADEVESHDLTLQNEQVALANDMFARSGETITHVNFNLIDGVVLTVTDPTMETDPVVYAGQGSEAIVRMDQIPYSVLSMPAYSGRTRSTATIMYQTSSDNMADFDTFGQLRLHTSSDGGPAPCVDLNARVRMWAPGCVYRRIVDCRPNDRVMTHDGKCQTVVAVRTFTARHIVHLPRDCIGRNVPDRPLSITPNHRIIVNGRAEPAGRIMYSLPGARAVSAQIQVCHMQTSEPCFLIIDGVSAESHVIDGARRPQLSKRSRIIKTV